jgi:hypothetical protein
MFDIGDQLTLSFIECDQNWLSLARGFSDSASIKECQQYAKKIATRNRKLDFRDKKVDFEEKKY